LYLMSSIPSWRPSSMYPNFAPSPPDDSRNIAKPSRVARTERALPSFDLESPCPCWMFEIVGLTIGGEGSDLLYRWRVNVAPCRLLRSWSRTAFRSPRGSRLVGWRFSGCIAPRSCAIAAVVLPLVEVDSP
jgi:hypothetical protein